jgi:hypothetical protein
MKTKIKKSVLYLRFKSEMPEFWKRAQKLFVGIGGSLVAVWVINETMKLGLDPVIISICKYGIAVCAAVTGMSTFTTTDKSLSEK